MAAEGSAEPGRKEFWDARYAAGAAWSGHVNPALAELAASLTPSTALDLGCGEGGDVLWLAENGWRATGVDGAAAALSRASTEAKARRLEANVELIHADLGQWTPSGTWDLVTCHYLHEVDAVREAAFRLAATVVAPGGSLLIAGHHPHEPAELSGPRAHTRFLAEDLVDALGLGPGWSVSTHARPRTSIRDGVEVSRVDTVLIATAPVA